MTERQAWAALAKGVASGRFKHGLCAQFACLPSCAACKALGAVRVSSATCARMRSRIDSLPNKSGMYKWTLGPKGQKARAAYCRRQVARLTPKRKPAPKRKAKR